MPTLSIITVTYNAAHRLEPTIQRVIAQTFTDYEYIIIDGGSTDGTLDSIRQYEQRIDYWISEPDTGLYDAMNKGLRVAKGEYVWFMNAGDTFYDENTLKRVFEQCDPGGDVYYGDALFVDEQGNALGLRSQVTPHRLPEKLTWRHLRYGMVVCHQSLVVRRTIAPLYNLSHRYSADVDWEIACLKRAKKNVHTHAVLSRYLTGGFSRKNLVSSLLDRFRVLQQHFGTLPAIASHAWIALRGAGFVLKRRKGY